MNLLFCFSLWWKFTTVRTASTLQSFPITRKMYADCVRCIGYVTLCCNKTPDKRQLKGERIFVGSWFKGHSPLWWGRQDGSMRWQECNWLVMVYLHLESKDRCCLILLSLATFSAWNSTSLGGTTDIYDESSIS